MKIPEMPKEQLDALAAQIKPLVRGRNGSAYQIAPVDVDKVSYIWDPKFVGKPVTKLKKLGEFKCLHTFGHPSLFKPSIGEVLRQIPANLLEGATYFEMVMKPRNLEEMKSYDAEMRAGFHVSIILVYTTKTTKH